MMEVIEYELPMETIPCLYCGHGVLLGRLRCAVGVRFRCFPCNKFFVLRHDVQEPLWAGVGEPRDVYWLDVHVPTPSTTNTTTNHG